MICPERSEYDNWWEEDSIYDFSNEFGAAVALEYVNLFDFKDQRLDTALRQFLSKFCLVGESSDRERVLTYFANRYHECNPGIFIDDGKFCCLISPT